MTTRPNTGSSYYRWRNNTPQQGDEAYLSECRAGWMVRHAHTGELMRVWYTYENNTQVHRHGAPALQLLPNDTEILIDDIEQKVGIKPGTSVRVLHPSKSAGKLGIVIKGSDRYQLLIPGEPKIIGVDRPFLQPTNTIFKEIE